MTRMVDLPDLDAGQHFILVQHTLLKIESTLLWWAKTLPHPAQTVGSIALE